MKVLKTTEAEGVWLVSNLVTKPLPFAFGKVFWNAPEVTGKQGAEVEPTSQTWPELSAARRAGKGVCKRLAIGGRKHPA